MRTSIWTTITLAIALAGCGGPEKAPLPPMASETPPLTRDPGAPMDQQSLQPGPPPTPEGEGAGAGADPRGRPDGSACLAATDCTSGVCEGQGCTDDRPGTCVSQQRICTRDLREYCGCDGKSFGASGTCPGRRYAALGPCK